MAYDFSKLKADIKETEEWLGRELSGVRTGRANPALLDSVRPEAYGTRTPLNQVAAVSVEDARTLRIVPWDSSLTKEIERVIVEADLGISPSVDDKGLRISFPDLTAERRTQLKKIAGERTETAKVTLRSHRTDAIKAVDVAEAEGGMGEDESKRLKAEIQKMIDAATVVLGQLLEKKKEEISR